MLVSSPSSGSSVPVFYDDGTLHEIYVDSVNGDDGNDGLTTGTALATIQEVYRKFPLLAWQGSVIRVNLAGDGGFGASATGVANYDVQTVIVGGNGRCYGHTYVYRGPEMVPVSPATGPATAALDTTPVVSVAGGSAKAGGTRSTRFDFTTASPGWTVNDLRGKFLRVTRGGVKVLFECPIASNTEDTITVRIRTLAGIVLATDTVEIVEPGAQFINTIVPLDWGLIRIIGGGGLDYDSGAGVGLSFTRVKFPEGIISTAPNIEWDRCDFGHYTQFEPGSSGGFINCVGETLLLHGYRFSGWPCNPFPTAPGNPINTNRLLDLQMCGTYGGIICGDQYGQATNLSIFRGLAIDGNTAREAVYVGFMSSLVLSYVSGSLRANIQGFNSGADPAIVCVGNGIICVHGNAIGGGAQPGMLSVTKGAGNELRVGHPGQPAIDYGTGPGEFEEVAGWGGHLHRFPAVPGDTGDASIITTQVLI